MHVLQLPNVNHGLVAGHRLLTRHGVVRSSRYGDTLELDEPVTTHYDRPRERVLFDPVRDANPFFHLFESLWILAGRRDVAFLSRFNVRMAEFSDNGTSYHASYGARLRSAHYSHGDVGTFDQLNRAVKMLREDPTSRRIVLQIWDAQHDLGASSKDLPCNDTIKLEARNGALNTIVFCRSNDILWGAYGANAVQFSMLQEYLAGRARLPVGYYEQISCNFHAYTERLGTWATHVVDAYDRDPMVEGVEGLIEPYPLFAVDDQVSDHVLDRWDDDNRHLLALIDSEPVVVRSEPRDEDYTHEWFSNVAEPMYWAWWLHKHKQSEEALQYLSEYCYATDWALAGSEWIRRRIVR